MRLENWAKINFYHFLWKKKQYNFIWFDSFSWYVFVQPGKFINRVCLIAPSLLSRSGIVTLQIYHHLDEFSSKCRFYFNFCSCSPDWTIKNFNTSKILNCWYWTHSWKASKFIEFCNMINWMDNSRFWLFLLFWRRVNFEEHIIYSMPQKLFQTCLNLNI